MSYVEEKIYLEILDLLKDNLRLLIQNNDLCLYYFKEYCKNIDNYVIPIDQVTLTKFAEDALYALLNADFLYDFREIE